MDTKRREDARKWDEKTPLHFVSKQILPTPKGLEEKQAILPSLPFTSHPLRKMLSNPNTLLILRKPEALH